MAIAPEMLLRSLKHARNRLPLPKKYQSATGGAASLLPIHGAFPIHNGGGGDVAGLPRPLPTSPNLCEAVSSTIDQPWVDSKPSCSPGEPSAAMLEGNTSFQDEIVPFKLPIGASPGRQVTFSDFIVMDSESRVNGGADGDGAGAGGGGGGGPGGWFGLIRPNTLPAFVRLPRIAELSQQLGFPSLHALLVWSVA